MTSEFLDGSGESNRTFEQAALSLLQKPCLCMLLPCYGVPKRHFKNHVGWSRPSGLRMLWPSTQRTWHRQRFMQGFALYLEASSTSEIHIKDKNHQNILCEWKKNVAFVFWEHFPCMSKCYARKAAWSQDVDAAWHEYPYTAGYYGIFRYSASLVIDFFRKPCNFTSSGLGTQAPRQEMLKDKLNLLLVGLSLFCWDSFSNTACLGPLGGPHVKDCPFSLLTW